MGFELMDGMAGVIIPDDDCLVAGSTGEQRVKTEGDTHHGTVVSLQRSLMNERRFRTGRTRPDLHSIVIATGGDRRRRGWTESGETSDTEIVSFTFEMEVTGERRVDQPELQITVERTRDEQIGEELQSNDRGRMTGECLQWTRGRRTDVPQIDQFIVTG